MNLVATGFHMLQDPISETELAPAWGKGNKEGTASIGMQRGASVRRLTPTECERLQGLDDNWTAPEELGGPGTYRRGRKRKAESGEEHEGWVCIDGVADGKRYAALGDAVTAPVAHWLGDRILRG